MKVIALIGLVSIEKINLAIALANHLTWEAKQSVTIVDNVARMSIDPVHLSGERVIQTNGDLTRKLPSLLEDVDTEFVLLAVSEAAELDELFVGLDEVAEQIPDVELRTVGLIDLRTCDCFPNLREKLEMYADVSLHAPFAIEDILTRITV